jgi:hypothetical protein
VAKGLLKRVVGRQLLQLRRTTGGGTNEQNEDRSFARYLGMNCRIDRIVDSETLVILRVSGRITGHQVDTLRNALESESCAAVLDLKNVTLADREAVKLLARWETSGTELRNCPLYVREWVTREREETKSRQSERGLEGREGTGDV